jgi:hypothetical protein
MDELKYRFKFFCSKRRKSKNQHLFKIPLHIFLFLPEFFPYPIHNILFAQQTIATAEGTQRGVLHHIYNRGPCQFILRCNLFP